MEPSSATTTEQGQNSERIRLYVPYERRHEAKRAGARWDAQNKQWYVDAQALNAALERFTHEPEALAHTVPMQQFVARAQVVALENHGRRFEVTFGTFRAFSDAPTPEEAARDAHRAAVNNALYFCENPQAHAQSGAPGTPKLPPQKVLSDYPQFAARVRALRTTTLKASEPAHALPAFVIQCPSEQLAQAKAAGAVFERHLGVYCAPVGKEAALELWRYQPPSVLQGSGADPVLAFAAALQEAGLDVREPMMDGKLHRVALLEGSKTNKDGAYKGFLDGVPAGFIQNHKSGVKMNWKMPTEATPRALSEYERRLLRAHTQLQAQQREAQLEYTYAQAALSAQQQWERAQPLEHPQSHPYLERKGVRSHGLRVNDKGDLLIPAFDTEGQLCTLQIIGKEAPHPKLFLKGGKKAGAFYTLGTLRAGCDYLVAEGYATAATLYESTGKPVVCAFDAGNLSACVSALTQHYPSSFACLCADDDRYGVSNTGITKAQACARSFGVGVIAPHFLQLEDKPTDFNDMQREQGNAAVRAHVQTLFIDQKLHAQQQLLTHLSQTHPKMSAQPSKGVGTYQGKVVLKVPGFVVQQTSQEHLVIHEASRMERQPRINTQVQVQYDAQTRRASIHPFNPSASAHTERTLTPSR